ncbi:unnamed protein product, partial [Heterosigma akashiwo]
VCKKFDSLPLLKAAIFRNRPQSVVSFNAVPEADKWFYNKALATFLEGRCFLDASSDVSLKELVRHLARHQFEGLPNFYPLPAPPIPPSPHDVESA